MIFFYTIAVLFTGAFITACLSYFLDLCFAEDMIFKRWLPFLERTIGERSFWYKPLGYCVICSNVWHSFITFPFVIQFIGAWGLGWWLIPLGISYVVVGNFFLRKMIND